MPIYFLDTYFIISLNCLEIIINLLNKNTFKIHYQHLFKEKINSFTGLHFFFQVERVIWNKQIYIKKALFHIVKVYL